MLAVLRAPLSRLLPAVAALGACSEPDDPKYGTEGGDTLFACDIGLLPHDDGVIELLGDVPVGAELTWGYDDRKASRTLGRVTVGLVDEPRVLMGFPDESTAWVEVRHDDCGARVTTPIAWAEPAVLPDWEETTGAGPTTTAWAHLLGVLVDSGIYAVLIDQDGQLVWQRKLSGLDADGMPTLGVLRRVRLRDGRLWFMAESETKDDRCGFGWTDVLDPPGDGPALIPMDVSCHHDWDFTPSGGVVFGSWNDTAFAERDLLIDTVIEGDPATGDTRTLADMADLITPTEGELALMEAIATVAGAGPHGRDLTYANGGTVTPDFDGDGGFTASWLLNITVEGFVRVHVAGDGRVDDVALLTEDPARSDWLVDPAGPIDELFEAPHGLHCWQDEAGDHCAVQQRGFTFPSLSPEPSCTGLTRMDLYDEDATVRWKTDVIGADGACVPSLYHGNVGRIIVDDQRQHAVFATGDYDLGGLPPTAHSVFALYDDDGLLLRRIENVVGRDEITMVAFASGPHDFVELSQQATTDGR
ncbi:MAG: hypothetical protein H6742_12645 [Alphaproteobacteria bacterium]|nr:hypothetical protein [Alphaproteobacteria bacterium]